MKTESLHCVTLFQNNGIQKYRNITGISLESVVDEMKYFTFIRFWAEIVGNEREHVYGGGEQYTYLDLKSRKYPIWVREQVII